MASELQENLLKIQEEIDTKLLPEHLMEGITILGIEGSADLVEDYDECLRLSDAMLGIPTYQEVNFICSSGTQYIDTGITPDSTTTIEVVFRNYDYQNYERVFGQPYRAGNHMYSLEVQSTGRLYPRNEWLCNIFGI